MLLFYKKEKYENTSRSLYVIDSIDVDEKIEKNGIIKYNAMKVQDGVELETLIEKPHKNKYREDSSKANII